MSIEDQPEEGAGLVAEKQPPTAPTAAARPLTHLAACCVAVVLVTIQAVILVQGAVMASIEIGTVLPDKGPTEASQTLPSSQPPTIVTMRAAAAPVSLSATTGGVVLSSQQPKDAWSVVGTEHRAIQHVTSGLWLTATNPRPNLPARLTLATTPDTSWRLSLSPNATLIQYIRPTGVAVALDIFDPSSPALTFWRPLPPSRHANQDWLVEPAGAAQARSDRAERAAGPNVTYEQLVAAIHRAPYRMPTSANQLEAVARGDPARQAAIGKMASATAIFLHAKSRELAASFLELKRRDGTAIERSVYSSMSLEAFLGRMLTHRPLAFFNPSDQYLLRTGEQGIGRPCQSCPDAFVDLGTAAEAAPLVLRDYMSYEEMEVAALLGVAVPSFLINDGARTNRAVPGAAGTFQDSAVIIDQTGCRLERPNAMEWKHMVVTPEQNVAAKGYGPPADPSAPPSLLGLFARFYGLGTHFPTFEEATQAAARPGGHTWWEAGRGAAAGGLLNVQAFRARYQLQAEAFLAECSARGDGSGGGTPPRADSAGAYCSVAESIETEPWWTLSDTQALWMLQGFKDALGNVSAPHVRVVDFPGFRPSFFGQVFGPRHDGSPHDIATLGETLVATVVGAAGNTIEIISSGRQPGSKLTGKHAGLLVVHQFAGDGNAYPGNEYWLGGLDSSGDPAAACFSLIPWLQNPESNPAGLDGARAHVWGCAA